MKPITKIIVFLMVAFIIVTGITFATNSPATNSTSATSSTATSSVTTSMTPAPTTPATTVTPAVLASYTLADVAKHKVVTDCWTTVNGDVFNLTPFVGQHPGGVENIIKICGIDGTATFMDQHGSDRRPKNELASLKIGTLKK